jgi:hypothetical protein
MSKRFPLLISGVLLLAVGCDSKKPQPSGAVDTSDPNKTFGTMTPMPKGPKDAAGPVGVPKSGAQPKAP